MAKKKKAVVDKQDWKPSMPQIEEVAVEDIVPYENNPRFNEEAVPAVAASLRDFGWKQPIVITDNGTIVAGHTRYAAALSLGMTHVPCVRATDLTPEQIDAYRLVDNKTNELATWDDIKLDEELDKLPQFDFTQYGFNYNGEGNDDIASGFDNENGDDYIGDDSVDIDKSKVSFKIPREFMPKVQKYIKSNGPEKIVAFILEVSGCNEADVQAADEAEDTADTDGAEDFEELQ